MAYDDVYNAHASDFNRCLHQVLFYCEVLDESIFDILEDDALISKHPTTFLRET